MKNTVIDKLHLQTLLYMALEEGLIEIDSNQSDGLDSMIKREFKPSLVQKQSLLEQITLTPNLLTQESLLSRPGIRGKLFDEKIIEYIPKPNVDSLLSSEKNIIPIPILISMLHGYGYIWDIDTVRKMMSDFEHEIEKHTTHFHNEQKNPPEFIDEFSHILETKTKLGIVSKYTETDFEVHKRFNDACNTVRPIINCGEEFLTLSHMAQTQNSLIKIGSENDLNTTNRYSYENRLVNQDTQWAIYKFVVHELNVIPYKQTLKDTLKLSTKSETVDLRSQIESWSNSLTTGDSVEYQKIKKDIQKAIKSLHTASNFSKVGNLVTYIGFPVTFMPQLVIPGITLSLVGLISTAVPHYLEHKNKWVMFGNSL